MFLVDFGDDFVFFFDFDLRECIGCFFLFAVFVEDLVGECFVLLDEQEINLHFACFDFIGPLVGLV
jgi:hypothetical protein